MRKLVYLIGAVVMLAAVPSVFAEFTTIPVHLSASSPLLDLCTGDSFYYAIYSFTAETSGDYTFAIANGPDAIMDVSLFTKGDFDARCLTNQKQLGFTNGGNGEAFTVTLEEGQSYEIIGTMGPVKATGRYDIILSGSAKDKVQVAAVTHPVSITE